MAIIGVGSAPWQGVFPTSGAVSAVWNQAHAKPAVRFSSPISTLTGGGGVRQEAAEGSSRWVQQRQHPRECSVAVRDMVGQGTARSWLAVSVGEDVVAVLAGPRLLWCKCMALPRLIGIGLLAIKVAVCRCLKCGPSRMVRLNTRSDRPGGSGVTVTEVISILRGGFLVDQGYQIQAWPFAPVRTCLRTAGFELVGGVMANDWRTGFLAARATIGGLPGAGPGPSLRWFQVELHFRADPGLPSLYSHTSSGLS